jgi:hypothetical protein
MGIVIDYGGGAAGIRFPVRTRDFSLVCSLQIGSGTYPMRTGGEDSYSLGKKRSEREANHSPPSNI